LTNGAVCLSVLAGLSSAGGVFWGAAAAVVLGLVLDAGFAAILAFVVVFEVGFAAIVLSFAALFFCVGATLVVVDLGASWGVGGGNAVCCATRQMLDSQLTDIALIKARQFMGKIREF